MIKIKKPSTKDIALIIFDDEIYDRISDDSCPKKEDFNLSYEIFEFLGCYLDNKIIGLAMTKKCGLFHFQVLKLYRKYAREALQGFLKKFDRFLYCEIPQCYQSVINFAKNNGFEEIGIIPNTPKFTKNNKSYNYIKLILKK